MQSEYRDDDEDALRPMIHRAAERGDTETATRLLDDDPDAIHTRNELDNEPLHEACWAKRPAMVRLLLDRGADVNAVGDWGRTPLHFAVWDGGTEAVVIVEMLVQAGADVNACDERLRENALGFALREYKDELEPAIRLFRELGAAEPGAAELERQAHGRETPAMKNTVDVVALLKPLFDEYKVTMKPASESSLNLFKTRTDERRVPQDVAEQLADFYSIIDGVPGLDSLDIHRCEDLILFEWWDQQELWLGQRDFYTLRWSWSKERFCIGDAGNVSFSASDEYRTFAEALRHMVKLYDSPESA